MLKRYIILQPIGNNKGSGVVSLNGGNVTVSLSGTSDEYNLYFMSSSEGGNELKIDAGEIRGGFAKTYTLKEEDVEKIDTVVLLKGNEPFIYGSLAPKIPSFSKEVKEKKASLDKANIPDGNFGFSWIKIEDGRFGENCPIIRHIFENINVLYKINSLGYYYYGTNGVKSAVALPAKEGEKNPFTHLADCARYVGGCWTVGADKKERYFFSLVD